MESSNKFEDRHFFNNPEVKELLEPILEVLHKMRDRIERCEYRYIIGDDASGRIPSLVFWNVLKRIYKDKGVTAPELYFIAGSGPDRDSKIEKKKKIDEYIRPFFDKIRNDSSSEILENDKPESTISNDILRQLDRSLVGRVLIVTELVVSGRSLSPLAQILHNNNVEFDIATTDLDIHDDSVAKYLDCEIFYPRREVSTRNIYHSPDLSGVVKSKHDILSKRYKDEEVIAGSLLRAREDVNLVSELIYESFTQSD